MPSGAAHPGIVVGVDGSSLSNAAVRWAACEATMRKAPLTLVHAAAPAADDWSEVTARSVLADAVEIVKSASDDCSRVQIDTELIPDAPVPALANVSAKADMIVVGSRGHGAVARLLLGSVAAGLVHRADCPVAVIHDEGPSPRQGPVLVGIDGSPVSELATAIAFDEASWRATELVALHAWTDAEVPDLPSREWTGLTRTSWTALQSAADETLAERLAGWRERYPDVTVRREVVVNRPAQHLLERAESAQLVVVGSHGRGGFAGMMLGSVGTAVMHAIRTPVIVARG